MPITSFGQKLDLPESVALIAIVDGDGRVFIAVSPDSAAFPNDYVGFTASNTGRVRVFINPKWKLGLGDGMINNSHFRLNGLPALSTIYPELSGGAQRYVMVVRKRDSGQGKLSEQLGPEPGLVRALESLHESLTKPIPAHA